MSSKKGGGAADGGRPPAAGKGGRRARGPSGAQPRPGRDEIEEIFWSAGLDLLVDGRRLFLGAEFVELMLEHDSPLLEPLDGGRYRLTLEGHVFELQPYSEEVDGYPVRWIGRAGR